MPKASYTDEEKALLKAFGERVRFYRLQRGWSQEDLAEQTGLHRTYIGSVERGERNVSLINIALLAKTLDVPIVLLATLVLGISGSASSSTIQLKTIK